MEVKIAHIADVHLGVQCRGIGSKSELRGYEIKNTLLKILNVCKDEKIDFLLIAGDLFDDVNISDNYICDIKRLFSKVDFKIIISPGNHDPFTSDSPYNSKWPENVYIFKNSFMECLNFSDFNLNIWGTAFQGVYKKERSLKNVNINNDDKINICVMHGNILNSEDDNYCPIKIEDIEKSNMDYIALGHIHKSSSVGYAGTTYFAYSGCPEGSGFDEIGDKGFYIGSVSKGHCNLKFQKICKRTYNNLEIDVSDLHTDSEIADAIFNKAKSMHGENCFENLYKVTLVGMVSEDFCIDTVKIESLLNDKMFFVTVIDKTEADIDIDRLKFRNDFKSMFIKKMIDKIQKAENPEEKATLKMALKIGLAAFEKDVKYSW